jgi:hypothetical protein
MLNAAEPFFSKSKYNFTLSEYHQGAFHCGQSWLLYQEFKIEIPTLVSEATL